MPEVVDPADSAGSDAESGFVTGGSCAKGSQCHHRCISAIFSGPELSAIKNMGRLSATGEALLWLRDYVCGTSPLLLCNDSDYAANITQGMYTACSNCMFASYCKSSSVKRATGRPAG